MFLDIPPRDDNFLGVLESVLSNPHVSALIYQFPNLDNLTIAVHRWIDEVPQKMDGVLMDQITFPSFRGRLSTL